jgi:hypothetical protein
MIHLIVQHVISSLLHIHSSWTTKTNCSLALGPPGAYWIMHNDADLNEIWSTKGGRERGREGEHKF